MALTAQEITFKFGSYNLCKYVAQRNSSVNNSTCSLEVNHSTHSLLKTQVEYLYGFNGFAADYVNAEINT